jgi:uncharacterized protein YceK
MSVGGKFLIVLPMALFCLLMCLLLSGCSGTTSADSTEQKYSKGAKDPGTGNPSDVKSDGAIDRN